MSAEATQVPIAFRNWVLGAGIFNTVAAFPLAMPFLLRGYCSFLTRLSHSLGLGDRDVVPPVDATNALFANTAGLALCLVGLLLIYASANLRARMGIPVLNAVVRTVFATLVGYYAVTDGLAGILIVVAVIDLGIAVAFAHYALAFRRAARDASPWQGSKTEVSGAARGR